MSSAHRLHSMGINRSSKNLPQSKKRKWRPPKQNNRSRHRPRIQQATRKSSKTRATKMRKVSQQRSPEAAMAHRLKPLRKKNKTARLFKAHRIVL